MYCSVCVRFLFTDVVISMFLSYENVQEWKFSFVFFLSCERYGWPLCVDVLRTSPVHYSHEAILRTRRRHVSATSLDFALQMLLQFIRSVTCICC